MPVIENQRTAPAECPSRDGVPLARCERVELTLGGATMKRTVMKSWFQAVIALALAAQCLLTSH
jgi:hypothetical protein